MRAQLRQRLSWKLFMLALVLFSFSSDEVFSQKKGDFVKSHQLIDFSIALAREVIDYHQGSHTITIFRRGGEIIVQFEPIPEYYLPEVLFDGSMRLHYKQIEGGYQYIRGEKP